MGPDSVIGEIVRSARKGIGLTQAEVASKSGYSLRAIRDLESGRGTIALLESVQSVLELRFTGLPKGPNLGVRIKTARLRRGWSLATCGERAGVSKNSVIRVENGVGQLSTVEAILRVLVDQALFRARKSEISAWNGGARDERFTPSDFLQKLTAVIGPIELDPCGHKESCVSASRYFYPDDDGLKQPWHSDTVFMNPPYSHAGIWVEKAHQEWRSGRSRVIAMLLPVRTNGVAFQDILAVNAHTFFLRHRVKFSGAKTAAAFPNLLAIFGGNEATVTGLLAEFPSVHLGPKALTTPEPLERALRSRYHLRPAI